MGGLSLSFDIQRFFLSELPAELGQQEAV